MRLSSRPSYAAALLDAVEQGVVASQEIPASAAGNIARFDLPELTARLEELWGAVQTTPKEKQLLIARYRQQLTPTNLSAANQSRGRKLFEKNCGNCHKMFGQGKEIGPDLTGSNRDDLNYLLENIVDPSRVVPAELRQSAVLLADGQSDQRNDHPPGPTRHADEYKPLPSN